jgi:hopanoid biosynthesis associated RND transporter like protein HpnN
VTPAPIARLVVACCRRAPLVAAAGLALTLAAGWYAATHFAMSADTAALISPKLKWRQDSAAVDAAFPQNSDLTAIVIDGQTPELAEAAADRLTQALQARPDLFRDVRRPDGGPFFQKEGLLLLPLGEVNATLNQLSAAQGFLGPLAADPSLRGVMTAMDSAAVGVQHGQATLAQLDKPMAGMADALDKLEAGQPAFFSWQALFASGPHAAGSRQFILVRPKLDYGDLEPGSKSSDAIRATAAGLGLDAAHGVQVRLTGSVPLNDEQFSSLKQRAGLIGGVMAVLMLAMLWLGVRSAKLIGAILATTLAGLVITAALGLLLVHRFNLISVAFIPLFVGLGVDFGIQFSIRFRAERREHPGLVDALAAAGTGVGGSLALAAAAIAVAFFAFLPTSYVGVSELGVIAGVGMFVAFGLAVTVLPALLMLLKPSGGSAEVGIAALGPLDVWLVENRRRALLGAGAVALVCVALLPFVRFDFNPLHLQNPHGEAMATVYDLMKDPQETPNTIDVLAPSLTAAQTLAARLEKLPQVSQVLDLDTFIPSDQTQKLAAISDAQLLLGPTLEPFVTQPPPSDAETVVSLRQTALDLYAASKTGSGPASADARRLSGAIAKLSTASPTLRAKASDMLIPPLKTLLAQLNDLLSAQPITRASLPPDLVRDWLAPDGKARLSVFPSGDSNDNPTLVRFAKAVRAIAPDATGTPITIQEAGRTIYTAFIQAGVLSFIAIMALLALVLRDVRAVGMTVAPILLTALLTLATCVAIGQPLNFANIIAFPLLLGIGVAFNIYFVIAWRNGEQNVLSSSLARAVLFSALTTGASFGSLILSTHPGTSGIGELLMIALGWTLVTVFLFEPALLGAPRPRGGRAPQSLRNRPHGRGLSLRTKDIPMSATRAAVVVLAGLALAACSRSQPTPAPAPAPPPAPNPPPAAQAQAAPAPLSLQGIDAAGFAQPPAGADDEANAIAADNETDGYDTANTTADAAPGQPSPTLIRAEVLLDRANFSPGEIDGRMGENVADALAAYDAAHALPVSKTLDAATFKALTTADGAPAMKTYTITAQDVAGPWSANVGEDFVKMSEQPALGYTSAQEMLAERFHMGQDLLKALNPGADLSKAGTKILVAAVDDEPPLSPVDHIDVDKTGSEVMAYGADGHVVAAYPATVGSTERPSPKGTWKVKGVAQNPDYVYNPAKLTWGPKHAGKLHIPPGPNNPVGVVWIALTAPDYGIHGTPDPKLVGKTASHGCVRLTNWDAERLSKAVRPGVKVSFLHS